MDKSTVCFNEVDGLIKEGYHGSVYRGKYRDRNVAIKKLKSFSSTELVYLLEFKHKGIVELLGHFSDNINTFMVLDLCIGDLKSIKMPRKPAAKFALQLLSAVSYIHAKGYIHGDLKPQNCLVDSTYACKLTDFGFTVKTTETQLLDSFRGYTSGYGSLELIEEHKCSPGSDVFALGATIYFGLTRENLFIGLESETDDQVRANITHGIYATQMKLNVVTGEMERRYARVGNKLPIRLSTEKRLQEIGQSGAMIQQMIQIDASLRPSCEALLANPCLYNICNCTMDSIFKLDSNYSSTNIAQSLPVSAQLQSQDEVIKLKSKLQTIEEENIRLRKELVQVREELAKSKIKPAADIEDTVAPVESTTLLNSAQRFNCQHCTKTFLHKSNARRHELIHKVPKFRCWKKNCDKTFARRHTMENHFAQRHKYAKQYKCSKCNAKFNHLYLRLLLLKTNHSILDIVAGNKSLI